MSSRFVKFFVLTQIAFDALVVVYVWSNHLWRGKTVETVTLLRGKGSVR